MTREVLDRLAVRARGVPGCEAPWAGLLLALARHVEVYVDPQFYGEEDAAALEAIAATVRQRVDTARRELRATSTGAGASASTGEDS